MRPSRGAGRYAAVAAVVLVAGCGGAGGHSAQHRGRAQPPLPPRAVPATLVLDFVPNAVHAGIYRALAAGYYRAAGLDLKVVQPSSTTDTLKLIDAGRAQFGLADGSDVAAQIAAGADGQAIMAIAQRPLGGLIALAREHLVDPAGLQGRTVGITGVPSDSAVLDTEVRFAHADPTRVRRVTIGFNGPAALVSGRIAAFTGFWPDDGVGLRVNGHPVTVFALDRYGGPPYPGLVAFTTRRLIAREPALVRGFVSASVRGYRDTLADPARSLAELEQQNPSLPRRLTEASLRTYLTLFGPAASFGRITSGSVRALSSWMLVNHLIARPVAPERYAARSFTPGG